MAGRQVGNELSDRLSFTNRTFTALRDEMLYARNSVNYPKLPTRLHKCNTKSQCVPRQCIQEEQHDVSMHVY